MLKVTFSAELTSAQQTTAKNAYKSTLEANYAGLTFTVTITRGRRTASYNMAGQATTTDPQTFQSTSTTSLANNLDTALENSLNGVAVTLVSSPTTSVTSSNPSSGSSNTTVYIIIGCVVGGVLAIGGLLIWCLCRKKRANESQLKQSSTAVSGASVVLFPSLAGSVLECEESPVEGYQGERIWMGLSTLMAAGGDYELLQKHHRAGCAHAVKHPFVQHLVLDPARLGKDAAGFKVMMILST